MPLLELVEAGAPALAEELAESFPAELEALAFSPAEAAADDEAELPDPLPALALEPAPAPALAEPPAEAAVAAELELELEELEPPSDPPLEAAEPAEPDPAAAAPSSPAEAAAAAEDDEEDEEEELFSSFVDPPVVTLFTTSLDTIFSLTTVFSFELKFELKLLLLLVFQFSVSGIEENGESSPQLVPEKISLLAPATLAAPKTIEADAKTIISVFAFIITPTYYDFMHLSRNIICYRPVAEVNFISTKLRYFYHNFAECKASE